MRERGHEDNLELLLQESQTEGRKIVAVSAVEAEVDRGPQEALDVAGHLAALSDAQIAHGEEKREDPRFPANETASMHPVSPLILDRSTVQVLNVSKRGLMLSASEFLQVGIVIQIRLKNVFVLGEVRYCRPVGDAFHVGVHIQDLQPR